MSDNLSPVSSFDPGAGPRGEFRIVRHSSSWLDCVEDYRSYKGEVGARVASWVLLFCFGEARRRERVQLQSTL